MTLICILFNSIQFETISPMQHENVYGQGSVRRNQAKKFESGEKTS